MISLVYKNIALLAVLVVLYTLELVFPYFEDWSHKTRHAFRNGSIILFNAIVINLLFVPLIIFATDTPWGVFQQTSPHWMMELLITILTLDLLTYVLHVLYHKIPFLWRFHRMHHSDTQMDVTTGARFHIGEHIISILARCLLYATLSVQLDFIVIYETIFVANVLFHHANITITEPLDRIYRMLFTSPNMHKVHHSNRQEETDSNYTSLFSFWDRLFGTYRIVKNPKRIVYGIKGLEGEQTVWKMFWTPFRKR